MANIDAGYKEIVRTLKPGGKIAFLIPHPADDFARRKDNTRAQEIITISLYDEKVSVYYPSHTFSNYFSEYFLRHFTLVEFAEFTPDEMGEQKHPTACVFGATKK